MLILNTIMIIISIIIMIIIIINIVIIIIVMFTDYPLKTFDASCSSLFCENGQQAFVKDPTESCTMILTCTVIRILMFSFSFFIQVPVSKSLLSPIRLFFVHALLAARHYLKAVDLHLIHIQLLGLSNFPHVPHAWDLIFKHFIFLNLS